MRTSLFSHIVLKQYERINLNKYNKNIIRINIIRINILISTNSF